MLETPRGQNKEDCTVRECPHTAPGTAQTTTSISNTALISKNRFGSSFTFSTCGCAGRLMMWQQAALTRYSMSCINCMHFQKTAHARLHSCERCPRRLMKLFSNAWLSCRYIQSESMQNTPAKLIILHAAVVHVRLQVALCTYALIMQCSAQPA